MLSKTTPGIGMGARTSRLLLAVGLMVGVAGGYPASAGADTITIKPQSTGTLHTYPELGISPQNFPGEDINSAYSKTTASNREFYRGFMEFAVPQIPGQIVSATLVLHENRGMTTIPVDPDVHELSSYQPADLVVSPDDYYRSTSPVASFVTDSNNVMETFRFDVTGLLISQSMGGTLGFRVKLDLDPAEDRFVGFGSSFGDLRSAFGPRIEVVTALTLVQATKNLTDYVSQLIPGLTRSARLQLNVAVTAALSGSPAQTASLTNTFIGWLDTTQATSILTPAQITELKRLAQDVITSVS